MAALSIIDLSTLYKFDDEIDKILGSASGKAVNDTKPSFSHFSSAHFSACTENRIYK